MGCARIGACPGEGFRIKSARPLSCGWVRFLCAGMMVVGTCLRGSVICVISHWLGRPSFASWDKSGPATPPLPSILWQATQPTETKRPLPSWTLAVGAVTLGWLDSDVAGVAAVVADPAT